jgi:hypothetical protein
MIQQNATPEKGVDLCFYEIGTLLKFVKYNDQEMPGYDEEEPAMQAGYKFEAGDLLRVADKNGCGMGIDVIRQSDGLPDMVWPEEVELVLT